MTAAVSTNLASVPDAPYPHDHRPWHNLLWFSRDKLGFLLDVSRRAPVTRVRLGPEQMYIVRDPAGVKHVLVDNNHNYDKDTVGYNELKIHLGHGLLTSEGDFWRRQRRIAQPAFHRARVAGFARAMDRRTNTMLHRWEGNMLSGQPLDISEEMTRLALLIAGETLLGADPTEDADDVGQAVQVLMHAVNRRMMALLPLPYWLPTPTNLRARGAINTIDRVVADFIEQRRSSDDDPGDLLSMLMHAEDADTGERMTDQQLRDEVITMFLAGHETTANALAWTFYLLSTHPEAARGIREEVAAVAGDGPIGATEVRAMSYTERVVKEAMRLYPPAWIIDRRSIGDDVICGLRVEKNSLVVVSPWVTHHDPELWPNPMGFDPDRFLPEREKERPRYAYFPFGGGPRMCIGQAFAMLEAVLIVASVTRRYDVALVPGHPVKPDPLVTLRALHGLRMTLRRPDRA